ncbi:DNA-binding domain-containing protein [Parabacteroides sp.]|uniref:DNA-binding domain-containing protein n=1 Tax=Parabacteroides sp. TaxID=1869337 RepID=UPI0026DFE2F7|nr:DNA-binding domain-containing protein [Parabacteroides sp.]MDO5428785.1 DNA-binding domain-containing protein [Parabacteroides sp.]
MKKVLKGWLTDNAVTVNNKTDKILLLQSAGNLVLDDVLEEMQKQDTGLRPETMRHAVTLYHRVVMDLILNGYSVNTGLFRAVPQLTGVIEGGVWNKEKNSIYVSFTQDKALREAIAQTLVEILGEKSNIMYILETEDKKTGLKDGSATAGRNFFVRGAMLKVAGDDETVGVTLTNAAKSVTKLTDDLITINNPSSLTLLLPVELTEGEYTLTITTQYSSSGTLLKTPRSVSTPIWIGGKPADGGSDSESPDEV